MNPKEYNVVIIGAGPAGASCALALRNSGLKVALIDKDKFPRDKTCGDAIPGPALKYLEEIIDESVKEFNDFKLKQRVNSSTIYLSSGASLKINWKAKAYNCTRISFDNFLLGLVKKHTETSIYEGVFIKDISRSDRKIHINARNTDFSISCDMLVGSDGANSIVSKTLNLNLPYKSPEGFALRAYYENVDSPKDSNEFYSLNGFQGYFWIFPLQENVYNVGIGMLRSDLVKAFDIKKYFHEIISNHPIISKKFNHAKIKSNVEGFKLPLGGQQMKLSGERYILAGDAAHLVDPLQGHGIDKAIKSGMLAAQHIKRCFNHNNFSLIFNTAYDSIIYAIIGKELKKNLRLMKLSIRFPWLVRLAFPIITGNIDLFLKLFYHKKKVSN